MTSPKICRWQTGEIEKLVVKIQSKFKVMRARKARTLETQEEAVFLFSFEAKKNLISKLERGWTEAVPCH